MECFLNNMNSILDIHAPLKEVNKYKLKLALFMIGLSSSANGWGGGQKGPFTKICKISHTGETRHRDTFPNKDQKIYKSQDTPLYYC